MRLACLQPTAPGVTDLVRCVLVPAPPMARSHFSDSEYHNLWGSLQAGESHVCSRQARQGGGGGCRERVSPVPPAARSLAAPWRERQTRHRAYL